MSHSIEITEKLHKAWKLRQTKKYKEAKQLVDSAKSLCGPNDNIAFGRIYHVYMQLEYDQGHLLKAKDLCLRSLAYYKKNGNPIKIAHSTRHLADLQFKLGLLSEAEENYRLSIKIYKEDKEGSLGNLANALRGFGLLLEACGNKKEAIDVWKEARKLYAAHNIEEGVDEANERIKLLQ